MRKSQEAPLSQSAREGGNASSSAARCDITIIRGTNIWKDKLRYLVGLSILHTLLSLTTDSFGEVMSIAGTRSQNNREVRYELIKDWDFKRKIRTVSQLRHEFYTRYNFNNGTGDHLGEEWQRYRDNDNHVFTNRGLSLVARIPSRTMVSGNIESGMIRSKWHGKYGYFEAKIKVPNAIGMWPAFWLGSFNSVGLLEIDVMEIIRSRADSTRNSFHTIHGAIITSVHTNSLKKNRYTPGFDYSDGFHVFGLDWDSEGGRFYVDGKLVYFAAFKWMEANGAIGAPVSVICNLAIGGGWAGPPENLHDFPISYEIEYIRLWQKTSG